MFVVGVAVVAGLLFLCASLLLGRGETQPAADPERSPVELPEDRPVLGEDVRALRISVAVRGYRMSEVDWLLDELAQTLDERDAELAALRSRLRDADADPATPRRDGDARSAAEHAGPGARDDAEGNGVQTGA